MEEVEMTEEELNKNIAENNPNMTENVKKGVDLGEWANTTKNNIILSHENLKSFSVKFSSDNPLSIGGISSGSSKFLDILSDFCFISGGNFPGSLYK